MAAAGARDGELYHTHRGWPSGYLTGDSQLKLEYRGMTESHSRTPELRHVIDLHSSTPHGQIQAHPPLDV